MTRRVACSWCHVLNPSTSQFCSNCGHNAQRPRSSCNCPQCSQAELFTPAQVAGLRVPLRIFLDGASSRRSEFDQLARELYGFSGADFFRDVDVCLEHGAFDPGLKRCPECSRLSEQTGEH